MMPRKTKSVTLLCVVPDGKSEVADADNGGNERGTAKISGTEDGDMSVQKMILSAVGIAAMGTFSGCVYLETSADRDLRLQQETILRRQAAGSRNENVRLTQELASLRTDLQAFQDSQRRLYAEIAQLQQDNQNRAEQIQELRGLVAAMESRLQTADTSWRSRMDKLKDALAQDQKRAIDAVSQSVGAEISRAVKEVQKSQAASGGSYAEYTVAPGDTLSAIAQAAGVSVEAIKAANGLTSDVIRVNQVLKLPVR